MLPEPRGIQRELSAEEQKYPKGYTYRTKCGRGRSTYDPDWSQSKPWSMVIDGTVLNYYESLGEAQRQLHLRGCKVYGVD